MLMSEVKEYVLPSYSDEGQQEWFDIVLANMDGGYSETMIRYAVAWATTIEERINTGNHLEDVAKQASRDVQDVDDEGVTGFMHGYAVSILAPAWKYGEQLRKWSNLDIQLNNEGESANADGGILNPALLVIGD